MALLDNALLVLSIIIIIIIIIKIIIQVVLALLDNAFLVLSILNNSLASVLHWPFSKTSEV